MSVIDLLSPLVNAYIHAAQKRYMQLHNIVSTSLFVLNVQIQQLYRQHPDQTQAKVLPTIPSECQDQMSTKDQKGYN
jgi:hypothetical protein